MDRVEKIVTCYKQMWIWIRNNLDSLRSKHPTIGRAKMAYRIKHGMTGIADCILCEAYINCMHCPLGTCDRGEGGYGVLNKYWHEEDVRRKGDKPVTKEEAVRCCDLIIEAHDELLKNPTQALLDKVEVYPL